MNTWDPFLIYALASGWLAFNWETFLLCFLPVCRFSAAVKDSSWPTWWSSSFSNTGALSWKQYGIVVQINTKFNIGLIGRFLTWRPKLTMILFIVAICRDSSFVYKTTRVEFMTIYLAVWWVPKTTTFLQFFAQSLWWCVFTLRYRFLQRFQYRHR